MTQGVGNEDCRALFHLNTWCSRRRRRRSRKSAFHKFWKNRFKTLTYCLIFPFALFSHTLPVLVTCSLGTANFQSSPLSRPNHYLIWTFRLLKNMKYRIGKIGNFTWLSLNSCLSIPLFGTNIMRAPCCLAFSFTTAIVSVVNWWKPIKALF